MTDKKTVVVFGASGAIGTNLIQIASQERPNWSIKAVSRSGSASKCRLGSLDLPNVEMVKGSVENLDDCKSLTENSDIVVSAIGLARYEAKHWAEHWPIIVKNLFEVTSSDRPLIFCDNLYAYGPKVDIDTSTETVPATLTSKPGVRATMRQTFAQRMLDAPQSLTVVGGADFFGPHVTDKSFLGDTFTGNMVGGKKPLAIGTAQAVHDFCYAEDFARALFVTAIRPKKAAGKFWICPHSIHGMTMESIAQAVNGHLDTPVQGMQVLPTFMVHILGWFMTFMRELKEMLPFWTNDYTIRGDRDFTETFGVEATPMDKAIQATVDFYIEATK